MVILCRSQYEMVLTVYSDLPAVRVSSKYDFFTSSPNISSLPTQRQHQCEVLVEPQARGRVTYAPLTVTSVGLPIKNMDFPFHFS